MVEFQRSLLEFIVGLYFRTVETDTSILRPQQALQQLKTKLCFFRILTDFTKYRNFAKILPGKCPNKFGNDVFFITKECHINSICQEMFLKKFQIFLKNPAFSNFFKT
jgi:hypothetical protein